MNICFETKIVLTTHSLHELYSTLKSLKRLKLAEILFRKKISFESLFDTL